MSTLHSSNRWTFGNETKSHDVTCVESEHVQRFSLLSFQLCFIDHDLVGNAGSLKEEHRVAHALYSVLCVQGADRTYVHCHRHEASCSPNRVCSKRAHRVSASHPLRMRKALARFMSCLPCGPKPIRTISGCFGN